MAEKESTETKKVEVVKEKSNLLTVDLDGTKEKTKLGKTISDVVGFVKKFLDVQIKAVRWGNGIRIEIYISHKLRLTKYPVTQTQAAQIIKDIREFDIAALKRNPAVKTSRAITAAKRYRDKYSLTEKATTDGKEK